MSRHFIPIYFKTVCYIAPVCLQLLALAGLQAGTRDPLAPGPVRPSGLNYNAESTQGYLIVYSATDRFEDGGVPYYPHSSYLIYTNEGKLIKSVENHVAISDETPQIVALPIGSYTVAVRSEKSGFVHLHVLIAPDTQTVLHLEGEQTDAQKQLARAKYLHHLVQN